MDSHRKIEMTNDTQYSPLTAAKKPDFVTFWELYECAAKTKYGDGIYVIKTSRHEKMVNEIDFDVSVVSMEAEPREARRTIVDINLKEYANSGKENQDETVVKAWKTSSKSEHNRYNFSTTKGIDFGSGGNIGAKVMGLAVAGGSMGITGHLNRSKSVTEGEGFSDQTGVEFSYRQEEKITVPAKTRVKAKITTHAVKYEMHCKLKFSIDRNATLPLWYQTCCQLGCFGLCRSKGRVNVRDMISTLPDYNEGDEFGKASFTQAGNLSWIGEGCTVEKVEEAL